MLFHLAHPFIRGRRPFGWGPRAIDRPPWWRQLSRLHVEGWRSQQTPMASISWRVEGLTCGGSSGCLAAGASRKASSLASAAAWRRTLARLRASGWGHEEKAATTQTSKLKGLSLRD